LDPVCERLYKEESKNWRNLVISGSPSFRVSKAPAKRGVEVISIVARGWIPNLTTCEDMEANVAKAVKLMTEEDYVVIHCFDNIAYMARSRSENSPPVITILKAT
jgi:hypothetical protein